MHHSDDTSQATKTTQDERLSKYRLRRPKNKSSPLQIPEVLGLIQKFFNEVESIRATIGFEDPISH